MFSFNKIKLAVLTGVLTIMLSAPLFSQTAVRLEALLASNTITWQEAAAFILDASGTEYNNSNAFQFASGLNWLPGNAAPEDPARLNGIALLLMQSFNLRGGIFYSITKSPHHAYRELVYKGIIRGNSNPRMNVTGQQLLLIVSRIISIQEREGG